MSTGWNRSATNNIKVGARHEKCRHDRDLQHFNANQRAITSDSPIRKLEALKAREAVLSDRWHQKPSALEEKFCAKLDEAGWRGADDIAESRAVNVAVNGLRAEELRMVERVEGFDAELQRFRFR